MYLDHEKFSRQQPRSRRFRKKQERGNAVIEVSLLAPWILFLLVGVLDFGFYSYAAITTENAARIAAQYGAAGASTAGDIAGACPYVLQEALALPGINSGMNCQSLPLVLTLTPVTGPDGTAASLASVTYQTIPMIPIPGILQGQLTLTRSVEMKVRNY
ncbi:MAG TPA: TadE family protein [Bryobacteraceae bacterium]|nr:TadE family protein [Bryobacteraceae bacterium]